MVTVRSRGVPQGDYLATNGNGNVNGRPTRYKKSYDIEAYKLCLLGATDVQLADFFRVQKSTINNWKHRHPSFMDSLKSGKIAADANVAQAFYHRALGYSHPDTHISNYLGDITVTKITKHYPPDTAAAFIWLKNRAGWRDRQEMEHSGNVTINMVNDPVLDGKS